MCIINTLPNASKLHILRVFQEKFFEGGPPDPPAGGRCIPPAPTPRVPLAHPSRWPEYRLCSADKFWQDHFQIQQYSPAYRGTLKAHLTVSRERADSLQMPKTEHLEYSHCVYTGYIQTINKSRIYTCAA